MEHGSQRQNEERASLHKDPPLTATYFVGSCCEKLLSLTNNSLSHSLSSPFIDTNATMFESSFFRLVASIAFAVLFAYLEQQVSLGILASALLTFVLFRQQCQRWLALVLFLSEVGLLYYAQMKYISFLSFLCLEMITLFCNPVGDPTKIQGWRPYEKEIRTFLLKHDPTVLHRVDQALMEFENNEKELLRLLKSSYAKRSTQNEEMEFSSSSSSNQRTGDHYRGRSDADGIIFQIRLLIEQHAPGISPHINSMLLDYRGKEDELLARLKDEFGVATSNGNGSGTSTSASPNRQGQSHILHGNNTTGGGGNKTGSSMGSSSASKTFGGGHTKWTHRDSEIIENAKFEAQQAIQKRLNEKVADYRR